MLSLLSCREDQSIPGPSVSAPQETLVVLQNTPEANSDTPDTEQESSSDVLQSQTLDELFQIMEQRGLKKAAHVIRSRVEQEEPKYNLTKKQAKKTANYCIEELSAKVQMPNTRKLLDILPRTTIELVRSVRERDVPRSEAEKISDFLIALNQALKFERRNAFDTSHSHVIGREWHQIDYSGEPMTWQQQKADWQPRGVKNFKRLEFLECYFRHVTKMKFFKNVYRPQGSYSQNLSLQKKT